MSAARLPVATDAAATENDIIESASAPRRGARRLASQQVGGAGNATLELGARGVLVVRFEGPQGAVVRSLMRWSK